DYIMESDLVDQLRGKLAAQGVAIFPSIREHVVSQVQDARGRAQYMATVTLDVTFIDGDSGDQMTTTWVGQGVDAGDKSYYKAYTGAFKYALLKTFLIAGEDDGNPEVRAPRQSSSRRRAGGRR
ncbi:MAG: ERF family protein, partial [Myxococcota bacterium]|nr:ERF family protein [Myxococcota bacterium]